MGKTTDDVSARRNTGIEPCFIYPGAGFDTAVSIPGIDLIK
jgi:hypothetical protein